MHDGEKRRGGKKRRKKRRDADEDIKQERPVLSSILGKKEYIFPSSSSL